MFLLPTYPIFFSARNNRKQTIFLVWPYCDIVIKGLFATQWYLIYIFKTSIRFFLNANIYIALNGVHRGSYHWSPLVLVENGVKFVKNVASENVTIRTRSLFYLV